MMFKGLAIAFIGSSEAAAIAGYRPSVRGAAVTTLTPISVIAVNETLRSTLVDGCGGAPTYPNGKPKNYADAQGTFFNTTSKKREPVTFAAGDIVSFQCNPGFTTDGSKDGVNTYDVECMEHGYYKPHGVCMEASKCGKVPNITHAAPTGKSSGGKVEFGCNQGYSLDGEKVVAGGLGKNRFFELKCVEFSGAYEGFTGECKAYAFVPATESIKIYTQVYEALFVVTCKGSLKTSFGKGKTPSGLDKVCAKFGDSSSGCQALVTQIKSDFESELKARQEHDTAQNASGQEWYDEKDPNGTRPGIKEEAHTFCTELWKLLAMPS